MKKLIAVIGARPQFIKHFPFELACRNTVNLVTVHTGQHFEQNMSSVFFDQLNISKPNYILQGSGGSHGHQTGLMMQGIEDLVQKEKPDMMIVYGDTNSTLAAALVASKLHLPVAHIEAGLRSYNKSMPEEINRVLTDHVSTLLFCPSEVAVNNLKKEGIENGVFIVGDLMKDVINYADENNLIVKPNVAKDYYFVTLHRPYNVDKKSRLVEVLNALNSLNQKCVFAIHPRTLNNMKAFNLDQSQFKNILFIEPQAYFENLGYIKNAQGLITDSGGMQKEAYWLKKKCITLRSETEWVETLDHQCNELVFDRLDDIKKIENRADDTFYQNLYGDGKAANCILEKIIS